MNDKIINLLSNNKAQAVDNDIEYRLEIIKMAMTEYDVVATFNKVNIAPVFTEFVFDSDYKIIDDDFCNFISMNLNIHPVHIFNDNKQLMVQVPHGDLTIGLRQALEDLNKIGDKGNDLLPIGQAFNGENIFLDLNQHNSISVIGSTGSGKSVFNHTVIVSLLAKDNTKLILIDAKRVEFQFYNNLPNLLFPVDFGDNIMKILDYCNDVIEKREELFKEANVDNFKDYNLKLGNRLERIVIVIDECSSLFVTTNGYFKETLTKICRSGNLGLNIIICTSRVSKTGIAEASFVKEFSAKICMAIISKEDSICFFGRSGGEKLIGHGDMILQTDGQYRRLKGYFVSDEELEALLGS